MTTTFTYQFKPSTEEHVVVVCEDGKRNEERCYYTDNKADCLETLRAMKHEEEKRNTFVADHEPTDDSVRTVKGRLTVIDPHPLLHETLAHIAESLDTVVLIFENVNGSHYTSAEDYTHALGDLRLLAFAVKQNLKLMGERGAPAADSDADESTCQTIHAPVEATTDDEIREVDGLLFTHEPSDLFLDALTACSSIARSFRHTLTGQHSAVVANCKDVCDRAREGGWVSPHDVPSDDIDKAITPPSAAAPATIGDYAALLKTKDTTGGTLVRDRDRIPVLWIDEDNDGVLRLAWHDEKSISLSGANCAKEVARWVQAFSATHDTPFSYDFPELNPNKGGDLC